MDKLMEQYRHGVILLAELVMKAVAEGYEVREISDKMLISTDTLVMNLAAESNDLMKRIPVEL